MGSRGPAPTPSRIKQLHGTYRADRANAGEVFPDLPDTLDPPPFLEDIARTKWDELSEKLSRNGLLTECDLDTLTLYCQTWKRWREAEETLATEGTTTVAKTGYQQVSPWVTIAKNVRADLLKLGDRLGLNPSARTRIHATPIGGDEDDLLA